MVILLKLLVLVARGNVMIGLLQLFLKRDYVFVKARILVFNQVVLAFPVMLVGRHHTFIGLKGPLTDLLTLCKVTWSLNRTIVAIFILRMCRR